MIKTNSADTADTADTAEASAEDWTSDSFAAVHQLLQAALGHPGPPFGSLAWFELERADPRRQASLVLAAIHAWAAFHGLAAPIAGDRLREQHRADLDLLAGTDPHAEWLDHGGAVDAAIERADARREAARRPRPSDFPGGSAPAWGTPRKAGAA